MVWAELLYMIRWILRSLPAKNQTNKNPQVIVNLSKQRNMKHNLYLPSTSEILIVLET